MHTIGTLRQPSSRQAPRMYASLATPCAKTHLREIKNRNSDMIKMERTGLGCAWRPLGIALAIFLACTSVFYVSEVSAEPTGVAMKILYIRPYADGAGGRVYIRVDQSTLCNTDSFMLDLSLSGSKEVYAAALSAFLNGRSVEIEVSNASGCQGWGTAIQSIYILDK